MSTYSKTTRLMITFLAAGLVMTGLLLGISWTRASGAAVTPQSRTAAAGTTFTYQGQLVYNNTAVNGACNLTFQLYDAAGSPAAQIGFNQVKNNVPVSNGLFYVDLDFGSGAFTGDARYLQITIDSCTNGASNVTLSPRVELKPAPYAINAATAPWRGLTGIPAGLAVYTRTIIVGPVGSDIENGAALQDAMNNITDAAIDNPYLIKLEPGSYDLGSSSLYMKPYVDIEGSGRDNTVIAGQHGGSTMDRGIIISPDSGTGSEIRNLGVLGDGSGSYVVGIYNRNQLTLKNVSLFIVGASSINIGVYNFDATLYMYDSQVVVDGSGVIASPAEVYGVLADGGSLDIYDSYILAESGVGFDATGVRAGSVIPAWLRLTGGRVIVDGTGNNHIGVFFYKNNDNTAEATISNAEIAAHPGVVSATDLYANRTGSSAFPGTLNINNSRFIGGSTAIYNDGHTVYVGNSQMDGNILKGGSSSTTYACVYVHSAYSPTTCP